jgi:hypothetical protein
MTKIAFFDFPEKWENVLPDIKTALQSKTENGIHGGLMALHSLIKKYTFEMDLTVRNQLSLVVKECFDEICEVVRQVLDQAKYCNEIALTILKLVCTIFYNVN